MSPAHKPLTHSERRRLAVSHLARHLVSTMKGAGESRDEAGFEIDMQLQGFEEGHDPFGGLVRELFDALYLQLDEVYR